MRGLQPSPKEDLCNLTTVWNDLFSRRNSGVCRKHPVNSSCVDEKAFFEVGKKCNCSLKMLLKCKLSKELECTHRKQKQQNVALKLKTFLKPVRSYCSLLSSVTTFSLSYNVSSLLNYNWLSNHFFFPKIPSRGPWHCKKSINAQICSQ